MASGSDSEQTSGCQGTIEQMELASKEKANEIAAQAREVYLRLDLPQTSPINIPDSAIITEQDKKGYRQVKYQWTDGKYDYTCRWHTRTPGAPPEQGDSWVVERHKPGIGSGPNARRAIREVLIGENQWIPLSEWQSAIRARKNGTATAKQKEILDHGHWKA